MYRIFLAEDDEMLCSLITKHLESWGYQVTAAEDFRDIMGEFVRSEAHLVLLDLKLPYFNTGVKKSAGYRRFLLFFFPLRQMT